MRRQKETVVSRNDSGNQPCFHTEGFIKALSKEGNAASFRIETVPPYLFEIKDDNKESLVRRRMLLLDESGEIAHIKDENHPFVIDQSDFTNMLIAKANHMKIRFTVSGDAKNCDSNKPLCIMKFEVL